MTSASIFTAVIVSDVSRVMELLFLISFIVMPGISYSDDIRVYMYPQLMCAVQQAEVVACSTICTALRC